MYTSNFIYFNVFQSKAMKVSRMDSAGNKCGR